MLAIKFFLDARPSAGRGPVSRADQTNVSFAEHDATLTPTQTMLLTFPYKPHINSTSMVVGIVIENERN